jgi:hypothetical protein
MILVNGLMMDIKFAKLGAAPVAINSTTHEKQLTSSVDYL